MALRMHVADFARRPVIPGQVCSVDAGNLCIEETAFANVFRAKSSLTSRMDDRRPGQHFEKSLDSMLSMLLDGAMKVGVQQLNPAPSQHQSA